MLKSPFPYFGGKSCAAALVWPRFGAVRNYVEPFFGSGAVLLTRPEGWTGTETVNDADGLLANFWRALKDDPVAVAQWADWPVNENDLHARHAWLVGQKDSLQARLEGDPDFYCLKSAGWWVWGMACWIGSGFCSGKGPWHVQDRQLVHLGNAGQGVNRQRVHLGNAGRGVNRQRVHLGNAGRGVNRQRVHLGNAGRGVNRQRVHLGNAGRGVNRQRVHLGSAGRGVKRQRVHLGPGGNGITKVGRKHGQPLLDWFGQLADRLQFVRVCCGDWKRVCGPTPTVGQGLTAVFLDPPYADTAKRDPNLYRIDSQSVAHDVREWALEHGDDPRLRIALCGYEGEHKMPRSWSCIQGKATNGGYENQKRCRGGHSINSHRERIWFSPHCLKPAAHQITVKLKSKVIAHVG